MQRQVLAESQGDFDKYATTPDGLAIVTSTDGVRRDGAYSVWSTGDTNNVEETYIPLRRDGIGEKIWKHIDEVFAVIASGKPFIS